MPRKLTILFAPLDAVGHMNACIGIGEVLRERGHKIVFVVSNMWREKLKIYGFEEEILEINYMKTNEDPAKHWAEIIKRSGMMGALPTIQKMKALNDSWKEVINRIKTSEPLMKKVVNRIKPDIILIDGFVWMPSVMNSGIPWVWSISCNPLFIDHGIDDEKVPPSASGLPTYDQKEWQKFRQAKKEGQKQNWKTLNDWLLSEGYPSLPENKLITPSPYLNIYMYPEEVDYTDMRQLPSNWHQFDCFMRSGNEENFEIPEKLRNKFGKLIYFSLGSMGSADVNLMKKLVSMLSKSKHRFIVSKGPLHDSYDLAHNMWGQKIVPQIKVLPLVDLVITHGGNNTFTETLFFGKPMIVMPLFSDQFDTAQRVQEKGFGVKLDPYNCKENELLESIEKLVNDEMLALKMIKISERIQSSNKISKIVELIEGLVN